MIVRLVIAIVATSLAAPFAFGITYSRPRPTPTPTPTPVQASSPIPSRKTTLAPGTTPTSSPVRYAPAKQQLQPKQTPVAQWQQQSSTRYAPAQQQIKPMQSPAPQWQQQQRMMPSTATQPKVGQPNPTPVTARYQARPTPTVALIPPTVVATPTPAPPPDVKAYLDHQIANSKDQKFHMNVNGKDLPLTPFHVWPQRITGFNATSTSISMRSDQGRVYDIEFLTTGAQVTSIRIQRVNGE
jgi:hypothetical protein